LPREEGERGRENRKQTDYGKSKDSYGKGVEERTRKKKKRADKGR